MSSTADIKNLPNSLRILVNDIVAGKVPLAGAVKQVRELRAEGEITDDQVARFKRCVVGKYQLILDTLR